MSALVYLSPFILNYQAQASSAFLVNQCLESGCLPIILLLLLLPVVVSYANVLSWLLPQRVLSSFS